LPFVDGAVFAEFAQYTIPGLPARLLEGIVLLDRGPLVVPQRVCDIAIGRRGPVDPPVAFRHDDHDGNGVVELTDAVNVLGYLLFGRSEAACHDAGDADDSGVLELTGAVRILRYQFLDTAPPEAPSPVECGGDPTGEDPDLACDAACP
jgi:hypothetical protein